MEAQKTTIVNIHNLALEFLEYTDDTYPNTLQFIYWELRQGYKFSSLQSELIKQTAQYLYKRKHNG